MRILEQLYQCVENHLARNKPHWPDFASGFKTVFGAEMALYRVRYNEHGVRVSDFNVITTSNTPVLEAYLEKRLFDYHPMPETELAPLEPIRRTDSFTDDEFVQFGELSEFMLKHGMFYLMVVPALMQDGTYVGLYLWRGQNQRDFDDQEKQRSALIMRYLLAIVDHQHLIETSADADVEKFGRKHGLTPTETGILAALLQGKSPKQIAAETGRTYGTVRWHIQNVLEKCHVGTQRSLLAEFYRLVKR
ncbi:MAG: helix-turn-helix transcriptional regulator [Roseibium sp.]|nr:helix-turn-helix transcriptional regulator [Roseibium sp.]